MFRRSYKKLADNTKDARRWVMFRVSGRPYRNNADMYRAARRWAWLYRRAGTELRIKVSRGTGKEEAFEFLYQEDPGSSPRITTRFDIDREKAAQEQQREAHTKAIHRMWLLDPAIGHPPITLTCECGKEFQVEGLRCTRLKENDFWWFQCPHCKKRLQAVRTTPSIRRRQAALMEKFKATALVPPEEFDRFVKFYNRASESPLLKRVKSDGT